MNSASAAQARFRRRPGALRDDGNGTRKRRVGVRASPGAHVGKIVTVANKVPVRQPLPELRRNSTVAVPLALKTSGGYMRKLLTGLALALPFALAAPASAMPGTAHGKYLSQVVINSDLIEVKGGRGRGHAFGRHGGHRAFGWSRGRKVGWRGHGCPPGLWRQGRC
jgi:hypothetical protein